MYTLLVTSGNGGGVYFEAEEVAISAKTVFGKAFDRWVIDSGNPTIADSSAASTTLTMGTSSASVSATYRDPVSVSDRKINAAVVTVFPNPATSEFSVAFTLKQPSEIGITLLDLSGREVGESLKGVQLNPGYKVLRIPVSGINPGAYIIKATINDMVHTELVIIK